jgi:CRP/FNR family transcriptional regulator, nitrogen fixation regulation protein
MSATTTAFEAAAAVRHPVAALFDQTTSPANDTAVPIAAVSANPFDALRPISSIVTVARNDEIYAEGDRAEYYYKVVSGAVRTCKLMLDGRRQIGEFLLPGDFFGLEALDGHFFSAEAVADTVLIRYPRKGVEAMAERDSRLAGRLRDLAYRSLAAAQERVVLLGRKTAQERVASFLLEMADRNDHVAEFDLPMSRYEIADYLGLTVETVSRALTQLRKDGTIALPNAQRIALRNRDALEDLRD